MQASSISVIKKELQNLPLAQLVELCVTLAKYKKDNKELFDYLLFRAHDEAAFLQLIKEEVREQFELMNLDSMFYVKKSLRKILRIITKYSKYSNQSTTGIELLLHFCNLIKYSNIDYKYNITIANLYQNQIKKVQKEIAKLHEDLQFDYEQEVENLLA
jgi:predicted S18 family serine protease